MDENYSNIHHFRKTLRKTLNTCSTHYRAVTYRMFYSVFKISIGKTFGSTVSKRSLFFFITRNAPSEDLTPKKSQIAK